MSAAWGDWSLPFLCRTLTSLTEGYRRIDGCLCVCRHALTRTTIMRSVQSDLRDRALGGCANRSFDPPTPEPSLLRQLGEPVARPGSSGHELPVPNGTVEHRRAQVVEHAVSAWTIGRVLRLMRSAVLDGVGRAGRRLVPAHVHTGNSDHRDSGNDNDCEGKRAVRWRWRSRSSDCQKR